MDQAGPSRAFTELNFYSKHFMDVALWEPFIRRACAEHGFTYKSIEPGLSGSYPTFIVQLNPSAEPKALSAVVIKFFGPLFAGAASFEVERAMGKFLTWHKLSLCSPAILADGILAEDWHYLIFEHIPGVSIGQVRQELNMPALEVVARDMGTFMRELHAVTRTVEPILPIETRTVSWEEYVEFLEAQRASCSSNHQRWRDLPPHLLSQLPDFILPVSDLLDFSAPPHLVHADLTADHLLGRLIPPPERRLSGDHNMAVGNGWESLGIIDWGDCRVGNILYELVALFMDLFQADTHLLRLCLEAYGLPDFYRRNFSHKALSMVLLHQFPMPARVYAPYRHAYSLAELAERLFGIL